MREPNDRILKLVYLSGIRFGRELLESAQKGVDLMTHTKNKHYDYTCHKLITAEEWKRAPKSREVDHRMHDVDVLSVAVYDDIEKEVGL